MGYYDHGPLVLLERPIAFIGFQGSDSAATAQLVASLMGLAYAEVDRLVEHDAGRSRAELARAAGLSALREAEARATRRALADRPNGIIALGDGALLDPLLEAEIRAAADLVYVERPFAVLLERMRLRAARLADELPAQVPNPDFHLDQLRALFAAREQGYLRAGQRLAAGDRNPQELAREFILGRGWPFAAA